MLSADERDAAQAENVRLRAELANMTDDYMRRHKDVGDFMEKNIALEIEIARLRAKVEEQAAIIHGMQDGALVRDQGALIDSYPDREAEGSAILRPQQCHGHRDVSRQGWH